MTPHEVFRSHSPYNGFSIDEMKHRVSDAADFGKLVMVSLDDGAHLAFTWMRPSSDGALRRVMNGWPPQPEDWEEEGSVLWIVDMAATPGVSGIRVGRTLGKVLHKLQIAQEGEIVVYRRETGALKGRFGKAIVRG